ncbi:histidine decarboxylase, pyruvoyl type [Alloyangia pacifica]|uniref:histidine decarboxylase, pyruvoyl type n=1 Tax=Alloyangia pacifica TaxID=311180 RepID=UPI001CD79C1D|nr:histidine decarboxylase, pyruvoyl type [Alloyangia pacifica]MCA0995089.1 histidine decarboxylase, pyruvoyl type [Alloyangia pacifica]
MSEHFREVAENAIGPFPGNCAGYGNPPSSGWGYVAALKLSIGTVAADMDEGLEGIVSYDRAECEDAYIGQINMITVSSFCGVNGAVWGYDLARADDLAQGRVAAKMVLPRHDGAEVPVLPMEPLLDAAYRLFGSRHERRFAPLPGAMVVCANKSQTIRPKAETTIWCALALAIAEDRMTTANLFIEDASDTESTGEAPLEDIEANIAKSILRCGADQGVKYREIFIGTKTLRITPDMVGCALACVPYVALPPAAIPPGRSAGDLADMTLGEWEAALNLPPMEPYPGRYRR